MTHHRMLDMAPPVLFKLLFRVVKMMDICFCDEILIHVEAILLSQYNIILVCLTVLDMMAYQCTSIVKLTCVLNFSPVVARISRCLTHPHYYFLSSLSSSLLYFRRLSLQADILILWLRAFLLLPPHCSLSPSLEDTL